MSKARPHAHIYEKWVRGIRTAVPDNAERCALYEYIITYQLAKVYDAAELPKVQNLSSAAAIALAMLEGDLNELCEARRENNDRRRENGTQNIPSRPEQTLAGASRPLQSNTIQSNTIQSNNNTMQDLSDLAALNVLSEFDFGLALLRKGYIIKATALRDAYESAKNKNAVLAHPGKWGFTKSENTNSGAPCANFVEATKSRDTRALEIYGVNVEDDVLNVTCTAAAERAIGEPGKNSAMQYANTIGAKGIKFLSNGQ